MRILDERKGGGNRSKSFLSFDLVRTRVTRYLVNPECKQELGAPNSNYEVTHDARTTFEGWRGMDGRRN
jgi:hypothetical protein